MNDLDAKQTDCMWQSVLPASGLHLCAAGMCREPSEACNAYLVRAEFELVPRQTVAEPDGHGSKICVSKITAPNKQCQKLKGNVG